MNCCCFADVRELFSIDGIAGQEKWKKNARFLPCISDERSEERQDGRGRMDHRMKECRSQISVTVLIRQIFMKSSSHRVNETLTAYKNAQGEFDSPVIKQLVSALATAVAVSVLGAMKGVMRTMASHCHGTSTRSTATENRLFAAVTSLTYENDRLQQYSRTESVRIFGIRQAEGETAEQVEQKALGVFKEAGADVKEEDIAAVHRVGKVGRGLRPILVKFVSRRKRREVMEKKKSLKGKDGYQKVYINDDLTPLRAKLLALVKRLDNVDKAWTVGGSIHCTKKVPPGLAPAANQRPVVVIDTPDDLFKLGLEQIDFRSLGLTHLADFEE